MKLRDFANYNRISKRYKTMSIISYITIAFILIAFFSGAIALYDTEVKKTAESFNDYILSNVVSSFEEGMWSMKNFQQQLLLNENLHQVVSSETDEHFMLDSTWDLIADLKTHAGYDDKIDLFFVYLKYSDEVLFNNGIVNAKLFYNAYFADTGITFEQWKSLISNEKEFDRFSGLSFSDRNGQIVDCIMLVSNIPNENKNNSLVILSDKQNFIGGFKNVKWEAACDIYIYNVYGRLVLYEKKVDDDFIPYTVNEIKKYEKPTYKVIIKQLSMIDGNWSLASRIPNRELNLRITMLQMACFVGLLCVLIIIFLFIRYFVKINYQPVKKLVDLFGNSDKKGEFEFLYDSIVDTIGEKKKNFENLKLLENYFQTVIIPQAVNGSLSQQMLDEYHSYFEDRQYILAVFYLENIASLFEDDEEMSNFERNYHLNYILQNVIKELLSEHETDMFFTTVDKFDLCVINLKNESDAEQIYQTLDKGIKFINEQFQLDVAVKVSKPQEGLLGISGVFEKMVEEFKPEQSKNEQYSFSLYKERSLVQCIKVGNKESALEIVQMLLSEGESKAERNYFNFVVLDIMATILKTLSEQGKSTFNIEEICDFYKKINMSVNTTEKVAQDLEEYVKYACNVFLEDTAKTPAASHVRAEEIQAYIAENFADCNLSLSMIADHFCLSRPHLSKIFKDTLGMTVLNYINNVRMEHADRLMKEGRYSLKEIAEMVGFGNVRSLYRLRKKNTEE